MRRSVWDTIARARANRAILMTTHSMEEADICCQKIGIMAKGTLRCLGSPSRLKELYGCGYKLKITFSNLQIAERFVISILPAGTKLLHNYQTMRIYSFTPDSSALADIFDHLVHNATGNAILSWGINQTTLDEIFTSVISEADASS